MNIAVVFPGQGSQSVGMLDSYAADWPVVIETFAQASSVLGYDLWEVVSKGPEDRLNQTEITQPAMLAADIAIMRVMMEQCMSKPFAFAGHSLGEYAALVAGGAIEFTDAVKLVAERGRLMQNAVAEGEGAMAAIIGLDNESVRTACAEAAKETNEVVEAVNYNSPGQVVIAGNVAGVELAMQKATEAGAKRAMRLPVSVPSHCALMKPAADELAEVLKLTEIKTPDIQVIHNVDAKSHDEPDEIRDALVKQLYNPVRWVQTMEILGSTADDAIVECGPGRVLTGLNRRIIKDVPAYALDKPESMQKFLDSVQ
jgi:[acyl-carrier-protein] S-malonyltransferase